MQYSDHALMKGVTKAKQSIVQNEKVTRRDKKHKVSKIITPNNSTMALLGVYPEELKSYLYTKPAQRCLQQLYS